MGTFFIPFRHIFGEISRMTGGYNMLWNITDIKLNTVHYTVLVHFLLLLLSYCYFERGRIKERSYRYFAYSLASIIMDGVFIVLFIVSFGRVNVTVSNMITFFIIVCHSMCTAFLLEWFYRTMDERGLSYHRASKKACNILLAVSLLINFLLSFKNGYSSLVFGKDFLALPNLCSFIYSFTIVGVVFYFSVRYRRSLPMAFLLCVIFLLLTPQILILSDMRLHAVCALYTTVGYFIVHRYYWILELRKREQEESEAKIRNLVVMRQILPHFVFNCLSSIEVLCEKDSVKAQTAVSDLAQLLRDTLDDMGTDNKKPFLEILEIINCYVRLEQMRFGNKIRVEYDIEETSFSLPPLILQPLVENAIKHGLARCGGTVKISTYAEGTQAVVCVEDDGVGMDAAVTDTSQTSHIGLENVRARLRLLCNGTMDIHSEKGVGTKITLFIPKGGKVETLFQP